MPWPDAGLEELITVEESLLSTGLYGRVAGMKPYFVRWRVGWHALEVLRKGVAYVAERPRSQGVQALRKGVVVGNGAGNRGNEPRSLTTPFRQGGRAEGPV